MERGKGGRHNNITHQEIVNLEQSGAPTFLIKTYQMISTCNPDLAEWSDNGETFVVKNTTKFEKIEIPQYFDHNNFSSFSRQLNFYGFKKVPNKSIRIDQTDKSSARYVKFHNEKFKRGRTDLLQQIQRSTKNGASAHNQEQEIMTLKKKVSSLETQVSSMSFEMRTLQDQVRQLLNSNARHPTPGQQMQMPATLAPHPNTMQIDPNLLPSRHESCMRELSTGFLENFQIDDTLFIDVPKRVLSTVGLVQQQMPKLQ